MDQFPSRSSLELRRDQRMEVDPSSQVQRNPRQPATDSVESGSSRGPAKVFEGAPPTHKPSEPPKGAQLNNENGLRGTVKVYETSSNSRSPEERKAVSRVEEGRTGAKEALPAPLGARGPGPSPPSPPKASLHSIAIYHKPRGTAGKYVPIVEDEVIRVSPQAGKRLRIMVHSTQKLDSISVSVQELIGDDFQDRGLQGVEILKQQIGVRQSEEPHELQLDIKLSLRGRLQFIAYDKVSQTKATSHQFIATNTPQKRIESLPIRSSSRSPEGEEEGILSKKQLPIVPPTDEPSFSLFSLPHNSPTSTTPPHEDISFNDTIAEATKRKRLSNGVKEVLQVAKDMEVDGEIRARAFRQYSDIRLKSNIEDLVDAMAIVNALSGKKYTWKEGTTFNEQSGGQKIIGLIAQQVKEVVPEVVHEDEKGWLSVSYADLVPVLINAFNEQTQETKNFHEEVRRELSNLKVSLLEAQTLGQDTDLELQTQLQSLKATLNLTSRKATQEKLEVFFLGPCRKSEFSFWTKTIFYLSCTVVLLSILILGVVYYTEHFGKLPDLSGIPFPEINGCADIGNCNGYKDMHRRCINMYGGFKCYCQDGYYYDDTSQLCKLVTSNFCENGNMNCSKNAECVNEMQQGVCVCKEGYSGDGVSCVEIQQLPIPGRLQVLKDTWSSNFEKIQYSINSEFSNYVIVNLTVDPTNRHLDLVVYPPSTESQMTDYLLRMFYFEYKIISDLVRIQYSSQSLKRDLGSSNLMDIQIDILDQQQTVACLSSENPCHPARPCSVVSGTFRCGMCNAGYKNSGETDCIDVDECMQPGIYCSSARSCLNLEGSYLCGDCSPPYNRSGNRSCIVSRSENVDCEFTWSSWSPCNSDCNGGIRDRSPIITKPPNALGTACPLTQMEVCNTGLCPSMLGCYMYFQYDAIYFLSKNSNSLCIQYCQDSGYSLAGTTGREGNWCACSKQTRLTSTNKISDDACSVVCPAFDESMTTCSSPFLCCGNAAYYSVFAVPSRNTYRLSYVPTSVPSGNLLGGIDTVFFSDDEDEVKFVVGSTDGIWLLSSQSPFFTVENPPIVLGDNNSGFGSAIATLGNVIKKLTTIVVGAPYDSTNESTLGANNGAIYFVHLDEDGCVVDHSKVYFPGNKPTKYFGSSITVLGDLNDDGIEDIAVGAPGDTLEEGVVVVLLMGANCSIQSHYIIEPNSFGMVPPFSSFGSAVSSIGDVNGDSIPDLVVGAPRLDTYGALYLLYMNSNGAVKRVKKIANPLQRVSGFGSALNSKYLQHDSTKDILVSAPAGGAYGQIFKLQMHPDGSMDDVTYFSYPSTITQDARFGSGFTAYVANQRIVFVILATNQNTIFVGSP